MVWGGHQHNTTLSLTNEDALLRCTFFPSCSRSRGLRNHASWQRPQPRDWNQRQQHAHRTAHCSCSLGSHRRCTTMRLQGFILRPAGPMLCQIPVLVWKCEWGCFWYRELHFWVIRAPLHRSAFAHDAGLWLLPQA